MQIGCSQRGFGVAVGLVVLAMTAPGMRGQTVAETPETPGLFQFTALPGLKLAPPDGGASVIPPPAARTNRIESLGVATTSRDEDEAIWRELAPDEKKRILWAMSSWLEYPEAPSDRSLGARLMDIISIDPAAVHVGHVVFGGGVVPATDPGHNPVGLLDAESYQNLMHVSF